VGFFGWVFYCQPCLEEVLEAGGEVLVAGQRQVQLVEVGGRHGLPVAGQAGRHVGVLAPELLLDHGSDLLLGLVGEGLLQQADEQLGEFLSRGQIIRPSVWVSQQLKESRKPFLIQITGQNIGHK
jgi:hypothetical protein